MTLTPPPSPLNVRLLHEFPNRGETMGETGGCAVGTQGRVRISGMFITTPNRTLGNNFNRKQLFITPLRKPFNHVLPPPPPSNLKLEPVPVKRLPLLPLALREAEREPPLDPTHNRAVRVLSVPPPSPDPEDGVEEGPEVKAELVMYCGVRIKAPLSIVRTSAAFVSPSPPLLLSSLSTS